MNNPIKLSDSYWNNWAQGIIIIAFVFMVLGLIFLKSNFRKYKVTSPLYTWIFGVFLTIFLMSATVSYFEYGLYSLIISANTGLRAFVMDGDITDILDKINENNISITNFAKTTYTILGSTLYIVAPMLTAGFILSFFKNFFSTVRYKLSYGKHIHFFSELNEKSLALATSINKQYKKNGKQASPQIVFADIVDKSEEKHLDLVDGAKKINAIFFRKDLESIKLTKKAHSIYLINDDETEKIRHAKHIISNPKYVSDEKKSLYIFSDTKECMCFMDSFSNREKSNCKMRIECINDIRFLIYHYLSEHGIELFQKTNTNNDLREISINIVGLGKYGIEMLKALLWYCQLPGFNIKITAFDRDENAESKLRALFPSIKFNEYVRDDIGVKYFLKVVSGTEVGTNEFKEKFEEQFDDIHHIFVTLGTDSDNLTAATTLRRYLEQKNRKNVKITTVIYNTALCEHVNKRFEGDTDDVKNNISKLQNINIHAFGDIESFYSKGTVIDSPLEKEGLNIHTNGHNEMLYYMDNYNFYSSLSKALHYRLRKNIFDKELENHKYFPEVFNYDNKSDTKFNIIKYIFKNTTSADKAKELTHSYNILQKKYLDQYQETIIEDILQNHTLMQQVPDIDSYNDEIRNFFSEIPLNTVFDVVNIAYSASKIEHIRWSAYLYTEGFVKGEKSVEFCRHNCLVSADKLSLQYCIYDI